MKNLTCGIVVLIAALTALAQAQSANSQTTDRESLIGAWHLAHIDSPGTGWQVRRRSPQPQGMLIYTRDGHMSVQLMYPKPANALSNEYVQDGYEASFGSYDINEATHTLTHHVQGSIHARLLVGKDLPRVYKIHRGRAPDH